MLRLHAPRAWLTAVLLVGTAEVMGGTAFHRAHITDGDKLLFATDSHRPVVQNGEGNKIDLLLNATSSGAQSSKGAPTSPGELPASFSGELPCAGMRWHLDLLADHSSAMMACTKSVDEEKAFVEAVALWR